MNVDIPAFFPELKRCVRCGMPETAAGIQYDEMGVCSGCRSQEMKMRIDWAERYQKLRDLLDEAKRDAGDNYDCIVPISGGKDSVWQLHVMKHEFGMKPLAVTCSHNWWSQTGWYNLQNALEKLDVDHVMFTPSRGLVNRMAKRSLRLIGDSCWHCHRGVDAFPLQMALAYGVKLLVWGESACEGFSGKATYAEPEVFDLDYVNRISTKARLEQMADGETLTMKDLRPYKVPPAEAIAAMGIRRIFLSDYMFWDAERCVEFIKAEYDWREDEVEGTYKKYKSVECIMPGVHDYSKFVKRGYGRAMDFAAVDARAGLMSVDETVEISRKIDPKRPRILDYYLKITGYTEDEFYRILMEQREGKAVDLPDPRSLISNQDGETR